MKTLENEYVVIKAYKFTVLRDQRWFLQTTARPHQSAKLRWKGC